MTDLKGKRIGLSQSSNRIKNDWWRVQKHPGIELMLRINGMTISGIELVEFPCADNCLFLERVADQTREGCRGVAMKLDHGATTAGLPGGSHEK